MTDSERLNLYERFVERLEASHLPQIMKGISDPSIQIVPVDKEGAIHVETVSKTVGEIRTEIDKLREAVAPE